MSILTAVGLKLAPDAQDAVVSVGVAVVGCIMALTADPAPVVVVGGVIPVRDFKAEITAALVAEDFASVAALSAQLAQK